MNALTLSQAQQLIREIETGTGRYAGYEPMAVTVTIDENGVGYIDSTVEHIHFAKVNTGAAAALLAALREEEAGDYIDE